MYFLRGSLPWQGASGGTAKLRYEQTARRMKTVTVVSLCRLYPTEFLRYFAYCRSLRFADDPDYAYLRRMFKDLFDREGFAYDNVFDWTHLNIPQERMRLYSSFTATVKIPLPVSIKPANEVAFVELPVDDCDQQDIVADNKPPHGTSMTVLHPTITTGPVDGTTSIASVKDDSNPSPIVLGLELELSKEQHEASLKPNEKEKESSSSDLHKSLLHKYQLHVFARQMDHMFPGNDPVEVPSWACS
jgi:hypothetical protein